MLKRIVSGGQTGADRGALEAAIALGIPHGGWCPKGRQAEDGPIPPRYQLTETPTEDHRARTRLNVEESDGTVILARGPLDEGSLYTVEHAERIGKPLLHVDLAEHGDRFGPASAELKSWILETHVERLNVAGPRESRSPGIEGEVRDFLVRALKEPETIEEAAEKLLWELTDDQKRQLRSLAEQDLVRTHFGIALYVRNTYGLFRTNSPLRRNFADDENSISGEIVRRTWQKLGGGR